MTKEMTEFLEAARPLIKYLAENHHPHTYAIVELDRAELVEGKVMVLCKDFIGD